MGSGEIFCWGALFMRELPCTDVRMEYNFMFTQRIENFFLDSIFCVYVIVALTFLFLSFINRERRNKEEEKMVIGQ